MQTWIELECDLFSWGDFESIGRKGKLPVFTNINHVYSFFTSSVCLVAFVLGIDEKKPKKDTVKRQLDHFCNGLGNECQGYKKTQD